MRCRSNILIELPGGVPSAPPIFSGSLGAIGARANSILAKSFNTHRVRLCARAALFMEDHDEPLQRLPLVTNRVCAGSNAYRRCGSAEIVQGAACWHVDACAVHGQATGWQPKLGTKP